ncbi:MAG: hypothetical protein R6X17_09825 [Candidatus Competibacteraceae bacterium]
MDRPRDIQHRILPKQHPGGIEQIQTRPGNRRTQDSVDGRDLPAGDPPDNVVDGMRPAEGRGFARLDGEPPEAVKQVPTDLPTQIRGNGIIQPGQRPGGTERAVQRDLRRTAAGIDRQPEEHTPPSTDSFIAHGNLP